MPKLATTASPEEKPLSENDGKQGETTEKVVIKNEGVGGIEIAQTQGEIKPPLDLEAEAAQEAEEARESEEAAAITPGKIPLSPAVIKPPLRFEGMLLAELTGYPDFVYTEEDISDICEIIKQCGWEATPKSQVLLVLLGIHAAKFAGYMAWKRAGRPGDLKKKVADEKHPERDWKEKDKTA